MPETDSEQLYIGANYDFPRQTLLGRAIDTRLKAGYAVGFGGADDQALVEVTFHW